MDKALTVLREAFNHKNLERNQAALADVEDQLKAGRHAEEILADALSSLSRYDSTWGAMSLGEGIDRLKDRAAEQAKELQTLRDLTNKQEDVLTAAKVALVDTVTADHQWHPPEKQCPHSRCVALNRIEALRAQ